MYLAQVVTTGFKPRLRTAETESSINMDKLGIKEKSSSLPGYARGFHDVFRNYQHPQHQPIHESPIRNSPGPKHKWDMKIPDPTGQNKATTTTEPADKKKKWTGWGGFFRRNKPLKKDSSDGSSGSGDEAANRNANNQSKLRFLSRKRDKREGKKMITVGEIRPPPNGPAASPIAKPKTQHPQHSEQRQQQEPSFSSSGVDQPVMNHGADAKSQPPTCDAKAQHYIQITDAHLGIPITRPSPSIAWATGDSIQNDLSASQTSLSRRERREAILARAAARRGESKSNDCLSSDCDSASSARGTAQRYRSQDSLASSTTRKSRSARTERYLQRRSRDEEMLLIQQQQQNQSQLSLNSQRSSDTPIRSQMGYNLSPPVRRTAPSPRWGASIGAYQETSEFESPVLLRKSTPSPAGSNYTNKLPNETSLSPHRSRGREAFNRGRGGSEELKICSPPPPPPRNPLKKSYLLQVTDCYSSNRPTSYSFGCEVRHDYQNVDVDGHIILDRSPSVNSVPLGLTQHGGFAKLSVLRNPSNPSSPALRRTFSPGFSQTSTSPMPSLVSLNSSNSSSPYPNAMRSPSASPMSRPSASSAGYNKPYFTDHEPLNRLKGNVVTNDSQQASSGREEKKPISEPAPPSSSTRRSASDFWRAKEAQKLQQLQQTKAAIQRNGSAPSSQLRESMSPLKLVDHPSNSISSASSLSSDLSSPRNKEEPHPPSVYAIESASPSGTGDSRSSCRTPNPPPTPRRHTSNGNVQLLQQQHHIRELSKLKPSNDRNLELAICELEAIYHSLRLSDEDLLDRAERRDLPTVHQEIRDRGVSVCSSESGSNCFGDGITSDLDTMMNWSISGSFESLATATGSQAGMARNRTPANRRSAVPDKVGDDMAIRRLSRKTHAEPDPQTILAKTGSYLLMTPAGNGYHETDRVDENRSGSIHDSASSEPDLVQDDVAYRQLKQANSIKVVDPQPPFGIPLGPIAPGSPSDYLHTNVTPEQIKQRPIFHPKRYPDLVRDDLAFRNLRKDNGHTPALDPNQVNTEKLDELLREDAAGKKQSTDSNHSMSALRKKRAVRSLSANIAQLIRQEAARPNGGPADTSVKDDDDEYQYESGDSNRTRSMTDLSVTQGPTRPGCVTAVDGSRGAKTPRAVKHRSDLKRNVARIGRVDDSQCSGSENDGADGAEQRTNRQNRPQASWVERANLSDLNATSTETLTDHGSNQRQSTTPERVPGLAMLYPKSALLAAKSASAANQSSQTLASDVASTLDDLILDLTESSRRGEPGEVDVKYSAQKPPSGARENEVQASIIGRSISWEESPLFRSAQQTGRCVSPHNSSDNSEASLGAREIQHILRVQSRSSSDRKKSTTPERDARKVATDLSSDLGATKSANRKLSSSSNGRASPPTTPVTKKTIANASKPGHRMSSNNNEPTSAEKRAERISRYKEERRKQLQQRQYASSSTTTALAAAAECSSSSNEEPFEEESFAKYKLRKQQQKENVHCMQPESSKVRQLGVRGSPVSLTEDAGAGTDSICNAENAKSQSNAPSSALTGIKRFIKRESPQNEETAAVAGSGAAQGMVRINRAARLRAAAAAAAPVSPPHHQETDKAGGQRHRPKRSSAAENQVGTDSAAAPVVLVTVETPEGNIGDAVLSETAPVTLRQKTTPQQREKDKSTKRKSNLNRALTEEQVINNAQSEPNDDSGKRVRRRRVGEVTGGVSHSSAETDHCSSIDNSNRKTGSSKSSTGCLSDVPMASPRIESPAPTAVSNKLKNSNPMAANGAFTPTKASDLRSVLRKTSAESAPAFIHRRSAIDVPETFTPLLKSTPAMSSKPVESDPERPPVAKSSVPDENSAQYPTVPWRTSGKVAIPAATNSMKAEDITARIEALTAMARQTVARVDRLTAAGDSSVKTSDALMEQNASLPASVANTTPVNPEIGKAAAPASDRSPSGVQALASRLNRTAAEGSIKSVVNPLPQSPVAPPRSSRNKVAESSSGAPSPSLMKKNVGGVGAKTDPDVTAPSTSSRPVQQIENQCQETLPLPAAALVEPIKAVQGILKKKAEENAGNGESRARSPIDLPKHGVRIRRESYPADEGSTSSSTSDPSTCQSILHRSYESLRSRAESPSDPISILKRKASREELEFERSTAVSEPHSILKRPPSRDGSVESRSLSPEPHSILKRKSSTSASAPGDIIQESCTDPRPILKKRSSADENTDPRPILKKKSSTDEEHDFGDKPKPILKSLKRTSSEQFEPPRDANEVGGILRKRGMEGEASNTVMHIRRAFEESPSEDSDASAALVRRQHRDATAEGTETCQLSVAERISSMETKMGANDVPKFSRDAPWRHSERLPRSKAPITGQESGSDSSGAATGAIPKRRKSLETTWSPSSSTSRRQDEPQPHSTPSAVVTEAVNVNVLMASPSITQPEESDSATEAGSVARTRLTRHARLARAIRSSTQPLQVDQANQAVSAVPEIKSPLQPPDATANQEGVPHSTSCSEVVTGSGTLADASLPQGKSLVSEDSGTDSTASTAGVDKIRGILRKKGAENMGGMKGILRSRSPSSNVGTEDSGTQTPRSILKKQSEFGNKPGESSCGSSSSEDIVVPPENDLAARLLGLQLQAKLENQAETEYETPPLAASPVADSKQELHKPDDLAIETESVMELIRSSESADIPTTVASFTEHAEPADGGDAAETVVVQSPATVTASLPPKSQPPPKKKEIRPMSAEIVSIHSQKSKIRSKHNDDTTLAESEENSSSSGTETITTVTLRLGTSSSTSIDKTSGSISTKKSEMWSKKETKTALITDVGRMSIATRAKKSDRREVVVVVNEDEDEEGSSSSAEVKTTVSLRLAALQKSGECEWRKRVPKAIINTECNDATDNRNVPAQTPLNMDSNNSSSDSEKPQASSIADRLKVLENAQLGWKKRVNETDAARFTVAGRMGRQLSENSTTSPSPTSSSPVVERRKKVLPKVPIKVVKPADQDSSSPGTPSVDEDHSPVKAFPPKTNGDGFDFPKLRPGSKGKDNRPKSLIITRTVAVPRPDDETFTSFFTSTLTSASSALNIASSSDFTVTDYSLDAFDKIIQQSTELIAERRTVQIQKRRVASRNPIKSLILRTDLQDEYEEINTGVAERELRRIKLEEMAKNSHLAVEALAGLASREDFTAVALKSTQNESNPSSVYLLHIKGRRHVQTRLVEPIASSVNSGDCYVLVMSNAVIQWIGRYSNVIERAKCSDVAQRIVLKKDLGCSQASQVQVVDEEKMALSTRGASRRFWKALAPNDKDDQFPAPIEAGPPEEDETFETAIVGTNMVWEMKDNELVPYEEFWGGLPRMEMLQPNKVLLFDFGCEMYVWTGKQAPFELRKRASQLAKELWDQGYDYSDCEINPIYPLSKEAAKASKQRCPWMLFGRASQHMEPVLFREKFLDWPDTSRLIKVKMSENNEKISTDPVKLQPYDAQSMIDNKLDDPDLELEGTHLGRGVEYYDAEERRLSKITTLSVKVWHISEYEKELLSDASSGQFHSRDTYIIRWQYRVTVTGRDLKGQASHHGVLGRDRCCYFFWHGVDAPATEQGASALTTVELDEERGPHVRVRQGQEAPAFLSLFQGKMAVHSGKREEKTNKSDGGKWRVFTVRGEQDTEANLLEVERSMASLRSRGSVLLINTSIGVIYLWHGAKSLKHTRQVAATAANSIKQHRPLEMGFQKTAASITIKEQLEGAESRDFLEGMGGGGRDSYLSLLNQTARFNYTPRLFHLHSWTGQFRADEVAPYYANPQVPCPYPFLQSDLYLADQPALFLLDNEEEIYLWQGWWPNVSAEENNLTGSRALRWSAERRCAMETVLQYCQLKAKSNQTPVAYLVSAGVEPLSFTGLFPEWTVSEEVTQLNVQEGRKSGEKLLVQEVLDRLKRTTYTRSELKESPLPEGVDPTRLESYLSDGEFQDAMGMNKEEFYGLPAWKQTQLRKEAGLF